MVSVQSAHCTAVGVPTADEFVGYLVPVSKLIVDIKRQQASRKYYACDQTWSGVGDFAASALIAYESAWAEESDRLDCRCTNMTEVFEFNDENLLEWTDQWADTFLSVDDISCYGNVGARHVIRALAMRDPRRHGGSSAVSGRVHVICQAPAVRWRSVSGSAMAACLLCWAVGTVVPCMRELAPNHGRFSTTHCRERSVLAGYVPESQLEQCVGQVIVDGWSKFAMDTWLAGECSIPAPPECSDCCARLVEPTTSDDDYSCSIACDEEECQSDCNISLYLTQTGLAKDVLTDETGADRSSCLKSGVAGSVQRLLDRLTPRVDETFKVRMLLGFVFCTPYRTTSSSLHHDGREQLVLLCCSPHCKRTHQAIRV